MAKKQKQQKRETFLFLGASSYRFSNQESGEVVSALNVEYVFSNNLDYDDEDGIRKDGTGGGGKWGVTVIQDRLPYELIDKIGVIPGLYSCAYDLKDVSTTRENNGVKTKQTVQRISITDFDFIDGVTVLPDSEYEKLTVKPGAKPDGKPGGN
jgi:hypothetical protein